MFSLISWTKQGIVHKESCKGRRFPLIHGKSLQRRREGRKEERKTEERRKKKKEGSEEENRIKTDLS